MSIADLAYRHGRAVPNVPRPRHHANSSHSRTSMEFGALWLRNDETILIHS